REGWDTLYISTAVASSSTIIPRSKLGSHEPGDPDTDYWNHHGDYRSTPKCPRWSFVHQHYNIYYAKAQKMSVSEIELLKCLSLGVSLRGRASSAMPIRATSGAETSYSLITSRQFDTQDEALILQDHPAQFASFSQELKRLQTKQ
ncbi:hypothetical protein PRIPAC_73775, partial [Pristionchus pacificus]